MLQDAYHREYAEHLVIHLLVSNVDAWRSRAACVGAAGAKARNWMRPPIAPSMRDFFLHDPPGVRWRIAQNIR
jgi:hypothetical protein